jgi:AraC-like DNA-binding protein
MQKTTELSFNVLPDIDIKITRASLEGGKDLKDPESHIHKECEIYVNLSGDVSFEVENRIYPVSRGSVIITRPYEYHHCIYLSVQRHEHFWITFSAEESDEFLKMFFCREKGRDNRIQLDDRQLEELCAILNELLQNETDFLTQRINFLRIFQILRSGNAQEHTENIARLPSDVILTMRFMDEHLSEDLDVKTVAAAGNVSLTTLERHFREAFHATPFAILRKKRLFYSMEQLRSGASVAEAALKSGFSDYSNYIQLFKKQFGMTPLQYKKKFELS